MVPLRGLRDGKGRSARLTFKLELDQLWIATAGLLLTAWKTASRKTQDQFKKRGPLLHDIV